MSGVRSAGVRVSRAGILGNPGRSVLRGFPLGPDFCNDCTYRNVLTGLGGHIAQSARGGRFELKIFPIPKRGSRRVVLAYTETIAPVGGVRRYVYPLPQATASDLRVDTATMDVQVIGADPVIPVRARGYELRHAEKSEGGEPGR